MKRTGVSLELRQLARLKDTICEIGPGIADRSMIGPFNMSRDPILKSYLNFPQTVGGSTATLENKFDLVGSVSPAEVSRLVRYIARQRNDLTKTTDKLFVNLLPVYEKWSEVF
ncbi:MAG: hypothetical protein WCH75_27170, partial [Candidatus Binatia bacterium]